MILSWEFFEAGITETFYHSCGKKKITQHLYIESKKVKLTEAKSRMVVARDWGSGKQGDASQREQTFSYRTNKS